MYDLAGLAHSMSRTGYIYVCPNAPIPVLIGQGMVGYSWRSARGDGGTEEAQLRQAQRVEAEVEEFFLEVMERYQVTGGRALLAGFSQGGGMAYHLGLSRPDLFAGIAALSCSIRDPEATRSRLPNERNQPVFIAHGLSDNPDRARQSRLEGEGYAPDYHEYDMGHEINQDVLTDLVPWMHRVLPPLQ